jgi:hypothetical protein
MPAIARIFFLFGTSYHPSGFPLDSLYFHHTYNRHYPKNRSVGQTAGIAVFLWTYRRERNHDANRSIPATIVILPKRVK